jgi:hypothetical protein
MFYGQKARVGQSNQKPNPADYPVKVHISATRVHDDCSGFGDSVSCDRKLIANAILDGKKFELSGNVVYIKRSMLLLSPGDYQAKLTKDSHKTDSTLFSQEYDLLLPDGTIWHCYTSGVSE